ncbi:MAG TPA: hypothetical protein VGE29_15055 [Prosthecobacter sp.]
MGAVAEERVLGQYREAVGKLQGNVSFVKVRIPLGGRPFSKEKILAHHWLCLGINNPAARLSVATCQAPDGAFFVRKEGARQGIAWEKEPELLDSAQFVRRA